MKYLYTFSLLLNFFVSLAQSSPQDFKNKYNYGKNLLSEQRYDLAQEALKSVLEKHPNNSFCEFAHFYYAFAAIQKKDYITAITTLRNFTNSSGNLKKSDDINYLLANALFLNNELVEGAKINQKILSPSLRKEAAIMQDNFVRNSNNIKDLITLYHNYTNDTNISYRLWQLLYAQKDVTTEKKILDELTTKYVEQITNTIQNSTNSTITPINSNKTLDIALLLPLILKETDATKAQRKNQFVIDYYYGLLVAQEKLREEGIETRLYLYDTEKDENKIRAILKNPTLQNTDLIIGPMFPKDTPPVVEFAMKNGISLVNPLTNNAEAIKKYENAYLTEPSSETMGSKAADYVIKNFSDTTLVYFGNQRQDSVLAVNFMNKFKALGGKVPIFKNISTFKNAFKLVSGDLAKYVGQQTKNSIFVAAADQTLAVNLLSGIQSNNLPVHIITTQDWLDFTQITYEQLEQSHVHFLFNSYLDYYLPVTRAFDTKYIDKSNMIPSRFSYAGHDALYYFVKMLRKYGKNIQSGVSQNEKIDGLLLQGFDYTKGHDNQRLAIGVFKEGKLEISYLE